MAYGSHGYGSVSYGGSLGRIVKKILSKGYLMLTSVFNKSVIVNTENDRVLTSKQNDIIHTSNNNSVVLKSNNNKTIL